MRICICDDEVRDRECIGKHCEDFFRKKGVTYEISMTGDAKGALEVVERTDLLVLDIELPGMDGITLKNQMQRSKQCMILFVTSHDEMMPEAFGMNVLGFVEKRNLSFKLYRYLTQAVNMMGRDVLIDGKYHSFQIVMIHSEREYCCLYFEDGMTALVRSSLKNMEQKLEESDFVRVSRDWLVHMKYLECIEKKEVCVAGRWLPVTRGCREQLYKDYERYCERNARYY